MKTTGEKFIIFALLVLTIPSIYFLLYPGFYEPHDLHHLADIYQMYRAVESGQMPPRWGPDFLYGFGHPLFNFYYLIPFYLGAAFFAIFGSLQASFEFVFIFSVLLSSLGMYLFLRKYVGKWSAFAGSTLFIYTPYRAVQIYVRGAMGEALALALLPWVALALINLVRKPVGRNLVILSVVVAVFILTHNYFWFLSAPFLFPLLLIEKQKATKAVKALFISGFLSLGLSAYWWLPALIEQRLVSAKTPFPLLDHFPFVKQLILPSWGYGSSVWGPGDGLSFQIGIVNLLVVLLFIAFFVAFRKVKIGEKLQNLGLWTISGFCAAVFFMNIRSYPLWKSLPFHDFIQFPWRLLFLTTFFSAVMGALVVELVKNHKIKISLATSFIAILLTLSYFRPSAIYFKSDNQYLSRFFANRSLEGEKDFVAEEYRNYSEDYLLLPNWVEEKPSSLPNQKIQSVEAVVTNIQQVSAVSWLGVVESESGAEVYFNSLYFPGWFVTVDGKQTETRFSNDLGRVVLNIKPGKHQLRIFWKETALRKFADIISISSLIICIGFCLRQKNAQI
jgi:hypothetical protein